MVTVKEAATQMVRAIIVKAIKRMVRLVKAVAIKARVEEAVPKVRRVIGHLVRPMPIGNRFMRRWRRAIPVIGRSHWVQARPVSCPRGATAFVRLIAIPLMHGVGS